MADREGFEPSGCPLEGAKCQSEAGDPGGLSSPISSRHAGNEGPELAEIVAVWPSLSAEIRAAILVMVRAAGKGVVL